MFCFLFLLGIPFKSLRFKLSHIKEVESILLCPAPFGAETAEQKGGMHPGPVEGMSVCPCGLGAKEISIL